jgi:hypothetical protein
VQPGCRKRLVQFRAIGLPAALDFNELGDDPPVSTIEVVLDGHPLALDAKTAFALFAGGDAVVSDEAAVRCHDPSPVTMVRTEIKRNDGAAKRTTATTVFIKSSPGDNGNIAHFLEQSGRRW